MPELKETGRGKLKMAPPGAIDEEKRKAFLEKPTEKIKEKTAVVLPWQDPKVNQKVIKTFNLRFPEPDFLKVQFMVDQGHAKSIHELCMGAVMEKVGKLLKEYQ